MVLKSIMQWHFAVLRLTGTNELEMASDQLSSFLSLLFFNFRNWPSRVIYSGTGTDAGTERIRSGCSFFFLFSLSSFFFFFGAVIGMI